MAHANIFISDGHVASDYGLWHPDALTDTEGAKHVHNFIQAYLWECWQHAIDVWLPSVCGKTPRVVWFGGDLVDGVQPKSPLCCDDAILQADAAEKVYGPVAKTAERVYAVSGTMFHAGKTGAWDNEVAKRLGAVPSPGPEGTRYARWRAYPIAVDGVVFNLAHKVRGSVVRSSRLTPLVNEYITAGLDCFEQDSPKPDWILRGHSHLYRNPPFTRSHVVSLPGWQAKTPFAWGIETGNPFDIGLFVVFTDEGRSWEDVKLYKWPTPQLESIGWEAPNQSQPSPMQTGPTCSDAMAPATTSAPSGNPSQTLRQRLGRRLRTFASGSPAPSGKGGSR